MAPDGRLVDQHQVELAQALCREALTYTEQQLGLNLLRPPHGRALLRRLQALHDRLEHLQGAIDALSTSER